MSATIIHNKDFQGQSHRELKALVNQVTLPALISTENVFHDLMSCVIEQQIHYRSSKKTFEKLLSFTSISSLTPDNFHEFEKLALPRIKLSEQKYRTIFNVLEFWENDQLDWPNLSDEAVRSKLGSINGIGNWTIDMILLFTLQRPDIFPADDYHLKQVMANLFSLDQKNGLKLKMNEIANRWRPHRSIAVRYLLEAKKEGLV